MPRYLIRLLAGSLSLTLFTFTCLPPGITLAEAGQRKIVFYHPDHLGSTNLVTDESGQVVQTAQYTPYGAMAQQTGSANVPQKFTGQRLDDSTGLYFYNARYYDASLGRFIQPDTFIQAPTDPQSLNRYSYVRNNPVKFSDPSGNFWFIPFLIGLIKATLIAAAITVATELLIQATGLEGTAAKAVRFIGAAASAAVGGYAAGLNPITVGRLAASSAYATLALDTGEGRQLTKSFAEGLQDLGVGRKASYIIASTVSHAVTSSAIFMGLNTVSPIPPPAKGPPSNIPTEGEGGRTVGDMIQRNSPGSRYSKAGEGWLATAPVFGDIKQPNVFTRFFEGLGNVLNIRHAAFLGPTGQDTASRAFPFSFPGVGTCQQQTFGGLISQSGLSGVDALAIMGREAGWTFFLTSSFYGVHGSLGLQGLIQGTTQQVVLYEKQ